MLAKTLPNLVVLEGGIAAGKTTLLRNLIREFNYFGIEEPATENPYLEKFYADPKRWAFEFQMWFLNLRTKHYQEACEYAIQHPDQVVLLDRSVFSDFVFALNGYNGGDITEEEFAIYQKQYNDTVMKVSKPTAIIYLDVDPELCLYRIKNVRCRECEMSIPVEYLQGLHSCYQVLLKQMQQMGVNVINIDWSRYGEAETINQYYESAREEVAVSV